MNKDWHAADAGSLYNVGRWGEGYFRIDGDGRVLVRPDPDNEHEVALAEVLQACRETGLRTPVLVRFAGILRHRVRALSSAFGKAIAGLGYDGGYTAVYPVKVNQQRRVVHEILNAASPDAPVGLEAGSKPELLAVMALSRNDGDVIVCNGYKDREYIRLALMGEKLGFRVTLVVEKLSELPLILEEARRLDVAPRIGLRVRLMSVGKGQWQNSGGEKAKFGLSAPQLLRAVDICREAGALDALQMLHFHLGSQVANIRDIKAGMREAARYYQELRGQGAAITTVDVGGGLGVDYEGTRSRSWCSMNYAVGDYAWHIVHTLKDACERAGLPEPDLISESGRALTAHHAVLLVNVIDRERLRRAPVADTSEDEPLELAWLYRLHGAIKERDGSPLELYQELLSGWHDVQERFLAGDLNLEQRARAESLYVNSLLTLRELLNPVRRPQRQLLDELNDKLADKLFVNFSVFQSVPDVWGIDQVFPVLPLAGLNAAPEVRAVIEDITCDSDGRMDRYVDGDGVESTLPLPADNTDELGIFMVGAYQEILGDMHNLFGDTDSVDVEIGADGSVGLDHAIRGDTVSSVLRYVNFDPEKLLEVLEAHCQRAHLGVDEREEFLASIRDGLDGYTYLE